MRVIGARHFSSSLVTGLSAVLTLSGIVIAGRIIAGPLTFPVVIKSPLASEGWFAVAGLVSLLFRLRGTESLVEERSHWLDIVAVVLTALAAFERVAGTYFLSDDFVLLKHAQSALQIPRMFTTAGGDGFFRPLGYMFFRASWMWAGVSPSAWHWIGFGLHAMNSALVLALARALGLSRFASVFAALLFSIYGTHPEAVLWVAGRFDLLATLFVLVALLCFVKSFDGHAALYRAAALVAMVLSILCKESAYALPLMLAIAAWRRRVILPLAPFFATAAGLLAYRWALFGGMGGYAGAATPNTLGLLKALALRLWTILFFPINWAATPEVWLAGLTVVYLGALFCLFQAPVERRRLMVPLALVLVAALPPVQQLLIGADLQKSRLLYLPSVGFCLLIATVAESATPRIRWVAAAAILAFEWGALQHNLNAWEYASVKTRAACAAAAPCTRVSGAPGSLSGVYFFANGFEECVRMQAPASAQPCEVSWDPGTDSIRPRL